VDKEGEIKYNTRQTAMIYKSTIAVPALIGKYGVALGGETISYTLKRSLKARLIWLAIRPQTGLTVTVPYTYPLPHLKKYLESKSAWILRNLQKYCAPGPLLPVTNPQPANTISYLGKPLKITRARNSCGLTAIKIEQNKLIVNINSSSGDLSWGELMYWLKNQAHKLINIKVQQFARQMGLMYNRVVIRDQRARWGSCSCRKNLNFNWRLIMAPEPVLDYVIIHELCHLKEMSHSKTFWNLVSRHCPKWHEYRNWLNNHSLELNATPVLTCGEMTQVRAD
jgi:predicted metal-dependent hydrolase